MLGFRDQCRKPRISLRKHYKVWYTLCAMWWGKPSCNLPFRWCYSARVSRLSFRSPSYSNVKVLFRSNYSINFHFRIICQFIITVRVTLLAQQHEIIVRMIKEVAVVNKQDSREIFSFISISFDSDLLCTVAPICHKYKA